ncbi:hypothetical protein Pelo_11158 [Pelomyxa schiedti]|nr:hypothetical protein Pelo_11158 [Pelomyxa schiedti]
MDLEQIVQLSLHTALPRRRQQQHSRSAAHARSPAFSPASSPSSHGDASDFARETARKRARVGQNSSADGGIQSPHAVARAAGSSAPSSASALPCDNGQDEETSDPQPLGGQTASTGARWAESAPATTARSTDEAMEVGNAEDPVVSPNSRTKAKVKQKLKPKLQVAFTLSTDAQSVSQHNGSSEEKHDTTGCCLSMTKKPASKQNENKNYVKDGNSVSDKTTISKGSMVIHLPLVPKHKPVKLRR